MRNGTFRYYANALKACRELLFFNLTSSIKYFRFASLKGRAGKRTTQAVEKHQGLSRFPLMGRIKSRHASVIPDSVDIYNVNDVTSLKQKKTHSK